ncbi:hypothetical protein [Bremerella cremea]|uniref:hypothetical protein n=1 Tax=Bremerella cremea TaxID=1031537 RepID=UPI0011C04184|nr:hypothetical protein [Bremerella cremea]
MIGTSRLSIRGRRFSLRFLLIGTALIAAGLGIWRVFSYRHPAHQFLSYQKAPYTSGRQMKVGPNTIAIRSVARNRYDGKIHILTGDGLSQQVPGVPQLKDCAKWLDVVQLEITPGPDLAELIQVRIFDHQTRSLLSELDPAYGWRVVEPNLIQIYGLGKEIPPKLDVWLRLNSHADDTVYSLAPVVGANVKIPGGTITVEEVQDRFAGWSSGKGFYPSQPDSGPDSAVILNWKGNWLEETRYQFVTVSNVGEREYRDRFMRLNWDSNSVGPIRSPFPLGEIDHFELRPFGGRHRFFFDGLEVPPATGRKFDPPPTAIIPVDGTQQQGFLTQFEPLRVRYRVEKGTNVHGSGVYNTLAWIKQSGPHKNVDTEFTLLFTVHGIAELPLDIRLQDASSGQWLGKNAQTSGNYMSHGSNRKATAQVFRMPLEDVKAIEVTARMP